MAKKESAENAIKDIRRKTRRRFSAEEKFRHPTRRRNEMWQTDFVRHEALPNRAVAKDRGCRLVAASS